MKTFFSKCLLIWVLSVSSIVTYSQSHYQSPLATTTLEDFLRKDSLKVLDIGNSYTDDATALLSLIVRSSDVDLSGMCLYVASRGGGSFESWLNCLHDKDKAKYSIRKQLGGINANVSIGTADSLDGSLFRKSLTDEQWDIILLHQVSNYAPYYELWTQNSSGGHLIELLDEIRQYQPNAVIGFLLVHSYWSEHPLNKEHSALERWKLIASSIKQLTNDFDIDFIIPYGTAVQNLRASSFNNEYDLTRDGTHLGMGLARYAAACCYYQSLIAPRSDVSVVGNPARYDASNANPDYHSSISVDDSNAYIAQLAADLAVKYPYECINPEEVLSIKSLSTDGNTEIYSLEGIRMNYINKGINIIKTKDGITRKVILK